VVHGVLNLSQMVPAALSASPTEKHRRRSMSVRVATRLFLRRVFMAAAFMAAVFSATSRLHAQTSTDPIPDPKESPAAATSARRMRS
jgi:hypothetical protein